MFMSTGLCSENAGEIGGSWPDHLDVQINSVPLGVCQCCDEYWRPGWRNSGGLYSASP